MLIQCASITLNCAQAQPHLLHKSKCHTVKKSNYILGLLSKNIVILKSPGKEIKHSRTFTIFANCCVIIAASHENCLNFPSRGPKFSGSEF